MAQESGDPAGALARLAHAAGGEQTAAIDAPLVLADADLRTSGAALLDLLDSPGDATAALVADPRNIEAPRRPEQALARAALARLTPDGSRLESVSTSRHTVTDPNRVVVGVLRIAATDRPSAARAWREAAAVLARRPEAYAGIGLFDLALLALVRDGLPIAARAAGYYSWCRHGSGQTGLGSSPWRQRLRSASRLGDGAYSAAVVRPLSRYGTRIGLRLGLSPNTITGISLAVGVAAGLLVLAGWPAGWIAAAVLLQLALVIDCVDGEIARFTRRFSAFGAWLDGIGDRAKEYLVLATVAVVAVRTGHGSGWLLAAIALVVVTARHLEDYAYTDRAVADRAARDTDRVQRVQRRPLDRADDGGIGATSRAGSTDAPRPRTSLPPPPDRRRRLSFWAKKVAHVPIAERYLVLSLMLLVGRPVWLLVAAIAVSGFALVWTVGGRLVRAVRSTVPPPSTVLAEQLDAGVLSRFLGLRRIPFLPGTMLLLVGWLVTVTATCTGHWPIAVPTAVLSAALLGCCWRPPIRHRFGWLALPLLWVAESAVLAALLAVGASGPILYLALAAVAYRRYELIYSLRLRAAAGPAAAGPAAALGADGRIVLATVTVAATAISGAASGPDAGLLVIAVATALEAAAGTVRRWRGSSRAPGMGVEDGVSPAGSPLPDGGADETA